MKLVLKAIADDRTKVNLLSIIIGGTGLVSALTAFNAPELNMMFLGENPFAIKKDAIASVMAWLFSGLAFIALLLQVVAEIRGDKLPPRLYSGRCYFRFSAVVFVGVLVTVFLLGMVGKRWARSFWWPQVVTSHTETFRSALFVIEHDGWQEDQLKIKDQLPSAYRTTNLEAVEQNISQIEKLLELPLMRSDIGARLTRLKPIFAKQAR